MLARPGRSPLEQRRTLSTTGASTSQPLTRTGKSLLWTRSSASSQATTLARPLSRRSLRLHGLSCSCRCLRCYQKHIWMTSRLTHRCSQK
jgi:hypothetical protein